jgi:hypothetical protein
MVFTWPGIDINVTPEIEVPIIPNATRNHGEFRFAVKKVWLSFFFEVSLAMIRSSMI